MESPEPYRPLNPSLVAYLKRGVDTTQSAKAQTSHPTTRTNQIPQAPCHAGSRKSGRLAAFMGKT